MKRIAKIVCFTVMILMVAPMNASAGAKGKRNAHFDWNPVINAIIEVESEGNPRAVSGKSCGILQITPILVKECNRILELRKSDKRYTMDDRYSVQKSKEMFLLFQSFYNPKNDVELAIRSWNGGMNYTVKGTQRYFEKVMSKMK
ncbi:MAG: lytic transglycosylase domain-containing protein [Prevotella sp.]|nr:lytic transglycosylase domain-containing protein [Prevotella sp.]